LTSCQVLHQFSLDALVDIFTDKSIDYVDNLDTIRTELAELNNPQKKLPKKNAKNKNKSNKNEIEHSQKNSNCC